MLAVVIGAGAAVPFVLDFIPEPSRRRARRRSARPTALCNSLWGYHPVALQPKGMVFTFIDFGPRLITVTHHDAVAGPYHRNGQQIADVMNAFRGERRPGAPADRQISFELSDDLPEQLDHDHLHGRGAQGLLRAARSAGRCPTG